MDSSTPIRPRTSLRRTLLKIDTPFPPDSNVDDELERSVRRSFIEAQKKATSVNQSPWANDSVRFNGEKEVKDHLQICTKLHAENKITERVAWQLQIFDVLRMMAKPGSKDTLQEASSGLDVGAKVYSLRVDGLHAEGLKLASSMARFTQKHSDKGQDADDQDGDNQADVVENPKKSKRKKYKTNGPKNTIAKDPSSLLAPLPKLESTCFSVRVDSHRSTVQNLFTNTLPLTQTCHKFALMTDEKAWPTSDDPTLALDEERDFDIDLLPRSGKICAAFENFYLDRWDPEEEARLLQEKNKSDLVVFDDQGIPVAEIDGPMPEFDANDDDLEDDAEQDEDIHLQEMQHVIAPVGDLMRPEDECPRSEYSYNSLIVLNNGKVMDRIWAGPSHWKLKFLRQNKSHFTGTSTVEESSAKKLKKSKLEPQPIDWNVDLDEIKKMLVSFPLIKNKKRHLDYNKVTLPLLDASCNELLNGVYELMTKPGSVSVPKKNTIAIDASNMNENELVNEDAQVNMDEDMNYGNDAMDNDDNFVEEEMAVDCQRDFMGANLVDAPDYVPKVFIPFAMHAKKMDMKKLKNFVWQNLTNSTNEKVAKTTFVEMYKNLSPVLPPQMQKDLSCSLAFSALLHCCNEHNLKLTQLDKDFIIESHVL